MNNPLNDLIRIAHNPATHDWVRKLIPELLQKDTLDVTHNLEMLSELFRRRTNILLDYHSGDAA